MSLEFFVDVCSRTEQSVRNEEEKSSRPKVSLSRDLRELEITTEKYSLSLLLFTENANERLHGRMCLSFCEDLN